MNKYEARQWLESEYSKLEGIINSLDENSVAGLTLDDGYPDYLTVYCKVSTEEAKSIIGSRGYRLDLLDESKDTYFATKDRALSIKLPGGNRWGYDGIYGGVKIQAPFANYKVYAYTIDDARRMLVDERQKFAGIAIKEIKAQIDEVESAIKKAQPATAIAAQAAIDSFVNEGGDGYYRPAPATLEQVPYLTRELSDLRQELAVWEALMND